MFSPQLTFKRAVPDHPDDTPEYTVARAEYREIMADVGLSEAEGTAVVKVFETELANGIPSDETVEAWGREATQQTLRQYGRDAEVRLREARALVRRDPRVRNLLNETGLGSHPKVVQLLIEKARSEMARGRLKP